MICPDISIFIKLANRKYNTALTNRPLLSKTKRLLDSKNKLLTKNDPFLDYTLLLEMESAANRHQKEEREKRKSNTVTANPGKLKRVYDKTSNVKSKYNEMKSRYDNITSAANHAQDRDTWLKNSKIHPTSQNATKQLAMQTAAKMLPQRATVFGT